MSDPGKHIRMGIKWYRFKIQRIQAFYMRKVKFTQQNIIERFQLILDQFPHLEVGFGS